MLLLFLLVFLLQLHLGSSLPLEAVNVYSANKGGWACYTSPVLLRTNAGSLLAFAQGSGWVDLHSSPSTGIQLTSGRILLPGYHRVSDKHEEQTQAHVWMSDDDGKTWRIGGTVPKYLLDLDWASNCQVAQTGTGRDDDTTSVMMDARGRRKDRLQSFSKDGGITWERPSHSLSQPEGGVQTSLISAKLVDNSTRLFTSAPMSTLGKDKSIMQVQSALPDSDWMMWDIVDEGACQGSSLAFVPEKGMAAILYEQLKTKTDDDVTQIVFGYA